MRHREAAGELFLQSTPLAARLYGLQIPPFEKPGDCISPLFPL